MAYYTKVLLPDEKLLHVGRLHWMIYLRGWSFLAFDLLAVALLIGSHAPDQPFFPSVDEPPQSGLIYVFWAFALACLVLWPFMLAGAWIRRKTTEIVVTDKRIIFKEGLVRRRTMEMNMHKVESVDVVQSIAGRIFGYGAIVIRGTGSTYEPLRMVDDPLTLRTAVLAQ